MRGALNSQMVIRRDPPSFRKWWEQWRRWVGFCSLVVLLGAGTGFVLLHLQALRWFQLQHIEVSGEMKKTSVREVVQCAGVKIGVNLFSLSLEEIRDRVLRNPWVEEASVRRFPPDTLWISVVEYTPKALAMLDRLYFVSEKGEIFKPLEKEVVRDLPVLTGMNKGEEVIIKAMLSLLDTVEALPQERNLAVSEIHYSWATGYSIVTLKRPIEIELGFEKFEEKLSKLDNLLKTAEINKSKIIRIDLNYEDKAFVKFKT